MKTCLVVDNSRVVRKVARKILEELEFDCDEVDDGEKALDWCRTRMPDGVLLSWSMPVMTGIEFLRELRLLDGGTAPKVVMCATENTIDHIKEALGAGANEYIMKPFDSDIIQSKFALAGLL